MNSEGVIKTEFLRRSLNYRERKREVTLVLTVTSVGACALGDVT